MQKETGFRVSTQWTFSPEQMGNFPCNFPRAALQLFSVYGLQGKELAFLCIEAQCFAIGQMF